MAKVEVWGGERDYHRWGHLGLLRKYLVQGALPMTKHEMLASPLPAVHPQEGHLDLPGSGFLPPQHT